MATGDKGDKPDVFTWFTTRMASVLGLAWVFAVAVAVLTVWAFTGPLPGFSDSWQLVINPSTTIVTFRWCLSSRTRRTVTRRRGM